MTSQEIDDNKFRLLNEVDKLVKIHRKKYGAIPNDQPMSKEEKESNLKIASIYSELNQLVILKKKLR